MTIQVKPRGQRPCTCQNLTSAHTYAKEQAYVHGFADVLREGVCISTYRLCANRWTVKRRDHGKKVTP